MTTKGLGARSSADTAITDVRCDGESLQVDLSDGRRLSVPVAWYPRLARATQNQRERWRLIGQGHGIHWPEVDEDISLDMLLEGRPSVEYETGYSVDLTHLQD